VKILLVDNGSLEPAATLALRDLTQRLAAQIGREIVPVSLLHSNRVAADQLDGVTADTVEPYLRQQLGRGETEFVVLPLFFGPSRAISEYLPGVVEKLHDEFPAFMVRIAPTLFAADEDTLAQMLAERVHGQLTAEFSCGQPVRVALVDHGSPARAVTAVRDLLARQLEIKLGAAVAAVAACSMERRPGPEYDFNEPMLETLLTRAGWNAGPVIVAQLFLAPGRHAGPEGDIAGICAQAEAASPGLRTVRTDVLGTHPAMVNLLADRLAQVIGRD
jgi:sirohydrochlorin ferrochelatase